MKDMDVYNSTSEEPTPSPGMSSLPTGAPPRCPGYDMEVIEEFLKEQCAYFLPGPPPPPSDSLGPPSVRQNHRTGQQNPSSTSNPVLVPRGTACKPNFMSQPRTASSSKQMSSTRPPPSSGRGQAASCSLASKGPASAQNQDDTGMLEMFLDKPRLVVVEEPKDRGMRFRYQCEGRSAGSITGASSADNNKTQPTIEPPLRDNSRRSQTSLSSVSWVSSQLDMPEPLQLAPLDVEEQRLDSESPYKRKLTQLLVSTSHFDQSLSIQGPIDRLKNVTVTVSLVTKDIPHRPHPHCLVGKDCPSDSGICVVSFNPHTNRRHSFANLGIQCVRRKELDISLQKRQSQMIDPFQTGFSKGIEDIDMNSVRLCFQCELEWEDGRKDALSPVISKPIYDKKATTTSELKICNLNIKRGTVRGKTEIYMLCDKVQKDDIEILFREGSWKANGEFAQTDVHRQIAIVFKTPPYYDQDVTKQVEVEVVLRRVSDQMESESVTFTYLPDNIDPYGVKRKQLKRDKSTSEKSCVTGNLPSWAQTDWTPDILSPLENQHPVQMEKFLQDCNIPDETLFNQLLEIPDFLTALMETNLLQELGTNTNFPCMDMSFNTNFGHPQDFAQLNDFQFNMLVNENQNPQAESQDGMLQVKTEKKL